MGWAVRDDGRGARRSWHRAGDRGAGRKRLRGYAEVRRYSCHHLLHPLSGLSLGHIPNSGQQLSKGLAFGFG
jgi:hypothetical protein